MNSHFGHTVLSDAAMEYVPTAGATCDTYRVKLYGKLHFLKRLKQQYVSNPRYVQAFRKEFEIGYGLEHPHLAKYLSITDDSILMEYVDGETLADFLQSHPDYFRKRKNSDKFLEQMLSVLQYLHSHQVLHLDLKPDNILVTRINHDLKLIDLGGSYADCFTDTTAHTDDYAAPEQLSGEPVDARTDLYALGRILQRLPDHHKYNKVIVRCTQPNPANRYQSAEEVKSWILRTNRQRTIAYTFFVIVLFSVMICGVSPRTSFSFFNREVPDNQETTTLPHSEAPLVEELHSPNALPSAKEPPPNDFTSANSFQAAESSSQTYSIDDLRQDIKNRLLPVYQITYGALPDSIAIDDKESYAAGYQMQDSIEVIIKDLMIAHGAAIPLKTITDEVMEYVHVLLMPKTKRN